MKYLAITAVLCLILAGASFAGNVTMTEVITGGNLTLTMPSDFSLATVTLGGLANLNAIGDPSADHYIEDSRGTGAGWNVGFQISQFVTSGTPQRSVSINNFKVRQADPVCVYGQTVDASYGPKTLAIDNTYIQNAEVKVITALADYGMGKYSVDTLYTLIIPAATYAGTYTATLTATLNNVP